MISAGPLHRGLHGGRTLLRKKSSEFWDSSIVVCLRAYALVDSQTRDPVACIRDFQEHSMVVRISED